MKESGRPCPTCKGIIEDESKDQCNECLCSRPLAPSPDTAFAKAEIERLTQQLAHKKLFVDVTLAEKIEELETRLHNHEAALCSLISCLYKELGTEHMNFLLRLAAKTDKRWENVNG